LIGDSRPFGGKIMLLGGDFRQTSPIMKMAVRSEILNLSIRSSLLWKDFEQRKLIKNMRARGDALQFAEDVLAIGDGRSNDEDDFVQMPSTSIIEKDLSTAIYSEVINNKRFDEMSKRAILAPYNSDVNEHNDTVLGMLPDREQIYYSHDSTDADNHNVVQVEVLNNSNCAGFPPHILRVKRNCITMLLRNLNLMKGLCNGTRLRILDAKEHVLRCIIITGNRVGKEVLIPRIKIINDTDFPFVVIRHQFPVRLAFAMTIHKSQGQSFEKIGIDFRRPAFGHGQTYVALSRTKAWDCIKMLLPPDQGNKIKNVVWKELLRD
jgi:hypothetical protein